MEEWYLDEENMTFTKEVKGISPILQVFTKEGEIRGYTPILWLYFDESYPNIFAKKNN